MNFSDYTIEFSKEKSQWLLDKRGEGFEKIAGLIKSGHGYKRKGRNKYSHQLLYAVEIKGYFWSVPCVVDHDKKTIFLKTAWQDRKVNANMVNGGDDER